MHHKWLSQGICNRFSVSIFEVTFSYVCTLNIRSKSKHYEAPRVGKYHIENDWRVGVVCFLNITVKTKMAARRCSRWKITGRFGFIASIKSF